MAKKPTSEEKIVRLKAFRDDPQSGPALEEFTRALKDRSNYVVARAAEMIGECGIKDLMPVLRAALDRFLVNPVKTDPQCLAKTAIAEALNKLGYEDVEFFANGMRYIQFEPVWGGETDTAAHFRGLCAFGLARSSVGDALAVLTPLAELLADSQKPARINAARAIAYYSRREAIPFVAGYLDSPDPDLRLEAATTLGESREVRAFEALKTCWENHYDPEYKKTLLIAMGLSRQQVAVDFLLSLIAGKDTETAADALTALGPCLFQPSVKAKAEAAVRQNGKLELQRVWDKLVGERKE